MQGPKTSAQGLPASLQALVPGRKRLPTLSNLSVDHLHPFPASQQPQLAPEGAGSGRDGGPGGPRACQGGCGLRSWCSGGSWGEVVFKQMALPPPPQLQAHPPPGFRRGAQVPPLRHYLPLPVLATFSPDLNLEILHFWPLQHCPASPISVPLLAGLHPQGNELPKPGTLILKAPFMSHPCQEVLGCWHVNMELLCSFFFFFCLSL